VLCSQTHGGTYRALARINQETHAYMNVTYPTANEMNHRFVRSNGIKCTSPRMAKGRSLSFATAIRSCGTLKALNPVLGLRYFPARQSMC
jgi:hypothetical protein